VLTSLKLGHLDVPLPSVLVIHVHLDDDVVAELGAGDVHVLVGVIATDDGRGSAARGGHSEGVIDTVPYEGPVCGGTRHGGAGAPAGEGWRQLK